MPKVGFNPPFGKQGRLAKRFLQHVAQVWQPDYIAFILPRRMRGTTSVRDYQLVCQRPVQRFCRPRTKRRVKCAARFVLLRRGAGAVVLSRAPRINVTTPPGVTLFARTRDWQGATMVFRAQGGGLDAMYRDGPVWRCLRAGKWGDRAYVQPRDAGWRMSVRAQGCDWCFVACNWEPIVRRCFLVWWAQHPDPVGSTYTPPSCSRTWLCSLLRWFYAMLQQS